MNLLKFALMITAVYIYIVYIVNVTVGLYAGILTFALLLVILPMIVPKERKMSISEEQALGRMKITLK